MSFTYGLSAIRLSLICTLATTIVAAPASLLAQWSLFPSAHYVDDNGQFGGPQIIGDRVAVVLEARSQLSRLPDAPAREVNIRGYLVTARLTDTQLTNSTREVIGPLYKVDGPMSGIANDAGAVYSKADREGLASKPHFSFSAARRTCQIGCRRKRNANSGFRAPDRGRKGSLDAVRPAPSDTVAGLAQPKLLGESIAPLRCAEGKGRRCSHLRHVHEQATQ